MPNTSELEAPRSPQDLYLAREDEAELLQYRPLFTGDILELADSKRVALVQHPCSMRRGPSLVPRLLVAQVRSWTQDIPPDWNTHLRRMLLPSFAHGASASIEFDTVDTLASNDATNATRVAALSQVGVNILMQRWINHLSRVVVPTITINEMIVGQFEEADLIGEAVGDLVDAGLDRSAAESKVDEWLDETDGGDRRRAVLSDPLRRSTIRTELRSALREWTQNS